MRILHQSISFILIFAIASPAFSSSDAIGQTIYSQAASVREAPLTTGSTLLSGETVTVNQKGIARIALAGGGQVELLDQSSARFTRSASAVQVFLQSGAASFRSEPKSLVEAMIADATIRSAPLFPAVALVGMETPDSAIVVATKGMLEIATAHDGQTVQVPEGSAARISLVPADPQGGGATPAGRGSRFGGISNKKLAIIALIVGGAVTATALILANREPTQPNVGNEVSPFKLN
jgi:hypothetical protein